MSNLDILHKKLLSDISDTYQKSEGFPTWDILKTYAIALADLWSKAEYIESKQNVDNLTGDELERHTEQRKGMSRKEATLSTGYIKVTAGAGTIAEGDLFETAGGVQFKATETKTVAVNDIVNIVAVKAGNDSNVPANTITQIPVTIAGIVSVTNPDPTENGYNAESDDSLRERYYEALRLPATSGNIYHYMKWAKEIAGVKAAKVFPLWNGDNTVQVVIINEDSKPASTELVEQVQNHIDPNSAGTGEGQAPIGAYCTVTAAETYNLTVSVSILSARSSSELKKDIEEAITDYLKSIAFVEDYVSIGKVSTAILNVEGVIDCENLTLNGSTARLEIPEKAVTVLAGVNINEMD